MHYPETQAPYTGSFRFSNAQSTLSHPIPIRHSLIKPSSPYGLSEEKSNELKDSFYEELEQVFDHFPKYHMKILLGDFNAKVGRENIFKPTIGKESLHQDSNDNGVRIVKFAT
jgi:hypothetical protein